VLFSSVRRTSLIWRLYRSFCVLSFGRLIFGFKRRVHPYTCHLCLYFICIFILIFIRFVFACRSENCVLIFTQTEGQSHFPRILFVLCGFSPETLVFVRLSIEYLHFYCPLCFISRLSAVSTSLSRILYPSDRILWRIVAKSSSKLSASHFQLTFDEFNLPENLQPKMQKLLQQLFRHFSFLLPRCR